MSASSAGQPAGLGRWSATALVIGHTIAVGIFLTPAELIGALASPALTIGLWIGCGALVLAGALTFGELASRYPTAGGPYVYLREAWGERVAFLYGWQSMLVMDPGVTAALATGMSGYLVLLWPAVAGVERWLAVGGIWLLAMISISGLRLSTRVISVLTAAKLLAFATVVVLAFAAGDGSWSNFRAPTTPPADGASVGQAIALALVAIFFSFGGFWEASRVAGEVRDAPRTVPLALAAGVTCVTVVYIATTMAFIYLVPVDQATTAPEFARRAGEAMLGPAGPSVLAAIVVLSVAGSALALLIMAPRLYVAMSRDGLFPAHVARLNPVTGSPARATIVLALLASAFVFAGTFRQIVAFFMCTTLVFIALAAAAIFPVRRRAPAAPFSSPAYPVAPALFVALVGGVVVLAALNQPLQAGAGAAIVLLGLPAHRLLAARGRRAIRV